MALSSIKLSRARVRRMPQSMLLLLAAEEIDAEAAADERLTWLEFLAEDKSLQQWYFDDSPTDDDVRPSWYEDRINNYYDTYESYWDEPPVELAENSWSPGDEAGYLVWGDLTWFCWLMEGVKACDIKHRDAEWVAMKHLCLSTVVAGGLMRQELVDEPSQIIGRYSIEIGKALDAAGIEHTMFGGIAESGYARLQAIKERPAATL